MTIVFEPIRPKKISEEIVDQVQQLIARGDLKPGERIPSERELAIQLGVSRPSVREALMVLEATGFIESRQGGGTFVRTLTETTLTDPLARLMEQKDPRMLHALAEVRMGLESWSAYLAAQRAEDREIEELRNIYRTMEEQAANGGWDADVDARFHYVITGATHNTVQVHVLDTIHTLFHTTIQVALTEFYRKAGYLELLLSQHREILDAIAARDPERARQKMLAHLTMVEEKLAQFLVNPSL